MHRWIRPLLAAMLILMLGLPLGIARVDAARGNWEFGDARYFTVDQICRDGATFSAVYSFPPPALNTATIDIGARLYTSVTTQPVLPAGSSTRRSQYSYGEALAPTGIFTLTRQSPPLQADINNNGTLEAGESFDVYFTGQALYWPRELQPGVDRVVITHSGQGFNWDYVQDCYLNRLNVTQAASVTLTRAHLSDATGLMPPADLVYRLTQAPANGALRLDGSPLAAGDTFTQDDVNQGRVSYAHNGSLTTSDAFNFAVAGTTQVSVNSAEAGANAGASTPSLSHAGSRIAFASTATNLTAGVDANGSASDIFVRDLRTGQTELASAISTTTALTQSNGASVNPAIAPDGFHVAFESTATNLGQASLYGTCLVFPGSGDAARDVYVWGFGSVSLRSHSPDLYGKCYRGNGDSYRPAIGSFGSYVAFESDATNLMRSVDNNNVVGGVADTNGVRDVFSHSSSNTLFESVANGSSAYTAGATGNLTATNPSLADVNGSRHIAFESAATDLVSGDGNALADIFVRSGASTTALVSRSTAGTLGNGASADPSLSADARAVAFESLATNLAGGADALGYRDIFLRLRDLNDDGVFDQAGDVQTLRVTTSITGSLANNHSYDPAVSAYGRFVAFQSYASNLAAGDTSTCTFIGTFNCPDIFLYDRETGQTQRVSVDRFGAAGGPDVYAFAPAISADGSLIAFEWGSLTNRQIHLRYTGYTSRFPIAITLLPTPTPTATQPPATSTPVVPVTGSNRVFLPAVQREP